MTTTRRNGAPTTTGSDRPAIHAYLTPRSHEVFNKFAEENGVSATALIEAMCVSLDERIKKEGYDCDPEWVLAARRIDAKRRRRG